MTKRVTLHLSPTLLVPDDWDKAYDVSLELIDLLRSGGLIETVGVGRSTQEQVLDGFCTVGQHSFHSPAGFDTSRPLPSICPTHDRLDYEAGYERAYAAQLEAINSRFDLPVAKMVSTGGGCMCIQLDIPDPDEPLAATDDPAYLLIGDACTDPLGPPDNPSTRFLVTLNQGDDQYGFGAGKDLVDNDIVRLVDRAMTYLPQVLADPDTYRIN